MISLLIFRVVSLDSFDGPNIEYDRRLQLECVRQILEPQQRREDVSYQVPRDEASDYHFTPGVNEWPPHPSLLFWRRGCGYRDAPDAPIQSRHDWYLFESGDVGMMMSGDIWHPRALFDSFTDIRQNMATATAVTSGSESSCQSSSSLTRGTTTTSIIPAESSNSSLSSTSSSSSLSLLTSTITEWVNRRQQCKEQQRVDAENDYTEVDLSRGVGDASEVADSAAQLEPSHNHESCIHSCDDATKMTPPPSLPPITQWPRHLCRSFLIAWQRLSRLTKFMNDVGINGYINFEEPSGSNLHFQYQDASKPIPFLLPWYVDQGERDERVTRYHLKPRWKSTRPGTFTDKQYGQYFHSDSSLSSSSSTTSSTSSSSSSSSLPPSSEFHISELSSVVRGCAWPLPVERGWPGNPPSDAHRQRSSMECGIVAHHLARSFHLHRDVASPIMSYDDSYYEGYRRLGKTVSDEVSDSPQFTDDTDLSCPMYIEDMFGGDGHSEILQSKAVRISSLLESSFVVSFASSHIKPWPACVVAPISRGWIGGFICAANTHTIQHKSYGNTKSN